MPTSSFPVLCHRFDLRDENDDIIIRWDVHVVRDDDDDWVEVYNAKYEQLGEDATFKVTRELIFSAPLDEAVEFFEKILGVLKTTQ